MPRKNIWGWSISYGHQARYCAICKQKCSPALGRLATHVVGHNLIKSHTAPESAPVSVAPGCSGNDSNAGTANLNTFSCIEPTWVPFKNYSPFSKIEILSLDELFLMDFESLINFLARQPNLTICESKSQFTFAFPLVHFQEVTSTIVWRLDCRSPKKPVASWCVFLEQTNWIEQTINQEWEWCNCRHDTEEMQNIARTIYYSSGALSSWHLSNDGKPTTQKVR